MAEEYTLQVLRIVVAQICQTIGWQSIQTTPLELLTDILHKYLRGLTREAHKYTELYGRTEPNLDDVALAFRNMDIDLNDLEVYVQHVAPVPCVINPPMYPVRKESNLNFLKPGSREVLTRPVHVYEYLPPMDRDIENDAAHESASTENVDNNQASTSQDTVTTQNFNHDLQQQQHNSTTATAAVFKKPESVSSTTTSQTASIYGGTVNLLMAQHTKSLTSYEEEGRPTREISSVMMTSAGFISPAREGKLPDSKYPILPEYKSTVSEQSQQSNISPTAKSSHLASSSTGSTSYSGITSSAMSAVAAASAHDKTPKSQQQQKKLERKESKKKQSLSGNAGGERSQEKVTSKKRAEKFLNKLKKNSSNNIVASGMPSYNEKSAHKPTKKSKLKHKEHAKHSTTFSSLKPTNKAAGSSDTISPHHPPKFLSQSLPQQATANAQHLTGGSSLLAQFHAPHESQSASIKMRGAESIGQQMKLTTEPDRQKMNIFKKISKKDHSKRVEISSQFHDDPSSLLLAQHPVLSGLSNETTVVLVDDESPPSKRGKYSLHHLPTSQNLSPLGIGGLLSPNLNTTISPIAKHHQPGMGMPMKKAKKRKLQKQLQQATPTGPLNLSSTSSSILFPTPDSAIDMVVKKDDHHFIPNNMNAPHQLFSHPNVGGGAVHPAVGHYRSPNPVGRPPKEKKERKTKQQKQKDESLTSLKKQLPPSPHLPPFHPSAAFDAGRDLSAHLYERDLNSAGKAAGSGAQLPTIPMFPFYSFPTQPSLIPSASPLFSTLGQTGFANNPIFNNYLSQMFKAAGGGKRQKFVGSSAAASAAKNSRHAALDVPLSSGQPSQTPIDTSYELSMKGKSYCNVAPLVPESMQLELSSTLASRGDVLDFPGASGRGSKKSNAPLSAHGGAKSSTVATSPTTTIQENSNKFPDTPIEISDDERRKSDDPDIIQVSRKHRNSQQNISSVNSNGVKAAKSELGEIAKSSTTFSDFTNVRQTTSGDDNTKVNAIATTASGVPSPTKSDRKKDKEHKKLKKSKDSLGTTAGIVVKSKKKKDKKDKSKSKDSKADKRKGKEDKRTDKERIKKLKKQKKKEKQRAMAAAAAAAGENCPGIELTAEINRTDPPIVTPTVPKLTFKFGGANTVGSGTNPPATTSAAIIQAPSDQQYEQTPAKKSSMKHHHHQSGGSNKESANHHSDPDLIMYSNHRLMSGCLPGGSAGSGAASMKPIADLTATPFSAGRRESSPELARISPLVTRPPKQQTKQQTSNEIYGKKIPTSATGYGNNLPSPERIDAGGAKNLLFHVPSVHFNQNSTEMMTFTTTPAIDTEPEVSYLNTSSSVRTIVPSQENQLQFLNQNFENFSPNSPNILTTATTTTATLSAAYSRPASYIELTDAADLDTRSSTVPTATGKHQQATNAISSQLPGHIITHRGPGRPRGSGLTKNSSGLTTTPNLATTAVTSIVSSASSSNNTSVVNNNDADGNQVWICPACGRVDDGTPMIGCDGCDAWYHWVCVGIQVPPDDNEDWYCRVCIAKKQEIQSGGASDSKKKRRKKKNKLNL